MDFDFTFEVGTSVFKSCSALLNGEYFVFGGTGTFTRQVILIFQTNKSFLYDKISKIEDCSLRGVGQLPIDFDYGACGTFLFPEQRVMLCFRSLGSYESDRACYR